MRLQRFGVTTHHDSGLDVKSALSLLSLSVMYHITWQRWSKTQSSFHHPSRSHSVSMSGALCHGAQSLSSSEGMSALFGGDNMFVGKR